MDFKTWLSRVDESFSKATGFSIHDMPDFKWRDLHESGCSPSTAVFEFADEVPEAGRLLYREQ